MTAPVRTTTLDQTSPADLRVCEILQSIRGIFIEKGFDGASMQDLAKAAGMSVGNFYRYFPSKSAIIEGMVKLDLWELEQDFAEIMTSPDPMQRLRVRIAQHVRGEDCPEKDGALWAEIAAVALRKPEIARVVEQMEGGIADYLISVFATATGLDIATAAERFGAHARLIVTTVKVTAVENAAQQQSGELIALILRMIDHILDEISSSEAQG